MARKEIEVEEVGRRGEREVGGVAGPTEDFIREMKEKMEVRHL